MRNFDTKNSCVTQWYDGNYVRQKNPTADIPSPPFTIFTIVLGMPKMEEQNEFSIHLGVKDKKETIVLIFPQKNQHRTVPCKQTCHKH